MDGANPELTPDAPGVEAGVIQELQEREASAREQAASAQRKLQRGNPLTLTLTPSTLNPPPSTLNEPYPPSGAPVWCCSLSSHHGLNTRP